MENFTWHSEFGFQEVRTGRGGGGGGASDDELPSSTIVSSGWVTNQPHIDGIGIGSKPYRQRQARRVTSRRTTGTVYKIPQKKEKSSLRIKKKGLTEIERKLETSMDLVGDDKLILNHRRA